MIEIDSLLQVTKDHQPIGGLFNAAQVLTEEEFNEALATFVSDKKFLETRLQQANALILGHEGVAAQREATVVAGKDAEIAALTAEKDALQTALTQAEASAAAALQEKADTLAANEAEVELIRQNTKTAITMAAQYIHALTETELSEVQAAAVSGLGGVLAFASKSEMERQYAAALAAAAEAQRVADELAAALAK